MWIPRLQILAAALLFSTGGVAIKSCSLGDWQIASLRCGVAAVVFLAVLPSARKDWSWRHPLVGMAYATTLICFALANKATTAANAIFLQSTAPLYVFLLAPLLLGERRRRRDLVLMVLMALGLLLLLGSRVEATAVANHPVLGNSLGALAGLSWALTLMGFRWLGNHGGGPVPSVAAGNLIGFALCLPMALPVAATMEDWGWLLYLGIFQIALPYMLLTSAIRHVPAFEAALLLLTEPLFNPLWAYLVHDELPRGGAFLGALVILLVTLLKPLFDQHERRRRARGSTPEATS